MTGICRYLRACCLLLVFGYASPASVAAPAAELALSRTESLAVAVGDVTESCQRYRARSWLRERIVRDADLTRYGLRLDDDWQRAPATRPVVILIHGFNSTRDQNVELIRPIRDENYACGTFAYPNDHTILTSAKLLSAHLRRFKLRYPDRRVALVCHSMGSLVARACIENPKYNPGNVDRLIMIAPPTHGTIVAYFAVGTDVYEHWLARKHGWPWRRVHDSIIDGLGEAADELCPNSKFLQDLNSRQLNPRVRYTVLLGTGARIDDEHVEWVRESFCKSLAKVPGANGSAERLEKMLDDIDEIVEGKGDGIVAVKRGRLSGVADTIVLPFGHMAVTGEPDNPVLRQVQQLVLQRVQ